MSLAKNAATIRPAPCAHGSRSLRLMHMGPVFCVRSLVGSSVAPVSGNSPACDLVLFAHPFAERGGVGGASSAHALTIATGCLRHKRLIRNGRWGEINRQDGFEAMVFGSLESDAEAGWPRNCHAYAAIGAPGKSRKFGGPDFARGSASIRG